MSAYEDFLQELAIDYPDSDYEIVPTYYGAEIYDTDGVLVDDVEFEPEPFAEQSVRY